MKKLIAIAICTCMCVCFFAGCSKDGDDPIENPNQPEPEKPAEVTLKLSTEDLAFEAKGGWKEFTINSSAVWTISGGNTWCQPGVTTGTGITQVKVMVEAYTGTTDRNAVLTVKAGSLSVTLTVTQKAVHALTLTKDKFDVPQEGGDIDIEVKSNINYTVSIPTAFQEWIKEAPKSKAMETKSFRFTVAANEEAEKREGYIVISGNELKDTVYVYQAEGRCLILDKDSCTLSAREQELTVELRTNVDYEVVVPDSVSGWVSCPPESRALRTDKLRLLIGENGLEEERQAVVIVKDRNSELADTLHIRQNQANALILGQKAYDVPAEGGTINVELTTNIDYKVVIPDSVSGWVSRMPESRALRTDRLGFLIGENDLTKGRQAVVIIQDQDSELADTLHIRQSGKGEPEEPADPFPNTHFRLGYKANSATTVTFTVHLPWEATVTYESEATGWLSVSPTSGEAGKATLQLTGTTTNEASTERNAYIDIFYGSKTQRLTVTQRANGEIDITDKFDPDFARALQKLGYIQDATNITVGDVDNLSSISFNDYGLTSLKGIEYFTALTELYCANNQLTTLDISKNAALTQLWCYNNKITTLDVSKNTALTRLDCNDNQLTTLDVSKNTALTQLWCVNNKITTLDVSGCTALTRLDCGGNQLTTLNVSGCPALTELSCGCSKLTTLDVSGCPALTKLNCYSNQLTLLDISKNKALTDLSCDGNPGNGTTFLVLTWFDKNNIPTPLSQLSYHTFILYNMEEEIKTEYLLPSYAYSVSFESAFPYAWEASVSYEGDNSGWLSISPTSGEAGLVTIRFDATENSKDPERKAYIDITYGDETRRITITQKELEENFAERFDPDFARVLQEKGYIRDATAFTEEDIRKIKEIDVSSSELTSLEGIKYFTALTSLKCNYNQLSTLDVSKNTALTTLECSGTQLTALDISKNTELTGLKCNSNSLGTLDVSKNTELGYWDCSNNQLSALDISKNTKLNYLECTNNQLTTLDVSQNTALEYLHCNDNQLTALDVSQNTALTGLYCNNNRITTLDVNKNTKLQYLYCSSNKLTTLDVSKTRLLHVLDCSSNQLTTLDVNNTHMCELECFSNKLTSLDISKDLQLRRLSCYGNPGNGSTFPITAWFDENNIPSSLNNYMSKEWDYDGKHITIEIHTNQFPQTEFFHGSSSEATLITFCVPTDWQASITYEGNTSEWLSVTPTSGQAGVSKITARTYYNTTDYERKAYIDIAYDGKTQRLTLTQAGREGNLRDQFDTDFVKMLGYYYYILDTNYIKAEDVNKIKELDVRWNMASMKGIEYFTELTTLKISSGGVSSLDVSKNKKLTTLNCSREFEGGVGELNVNGCTALTTLNCSGSYLIELDVSGCPALTTLNCSNCGLIKFNMDGCTELTSLNCSNNQLTSLDVSKCSALTELHCGGNLFPTLDISQNAALTTLSCNKSRLSTLDVSGHTALTTLECNGEVQESSFGSLEYKSQLTTLNVSGCTALTTLSCKDNPLTTLNVSGCTALTKLDCSTNRLTALDVSRNTALTTLNCDGNPLGTLDVSQNAALTTLSCNNSRLSTLDVSGHTALTTLKCNGKNQQLSNGSWKYNGQLTTLNVSGCTALNSLSCTDNRITTLDVSGCTKLTYLYCYNNRLTTLDMSPNTALTGLYCYNNQITALDVSRCTALTNLSCYQNRLTTLNVSECTALTTLECNDNQLSTLHMGNCTKLTDLNCTNNKLPSLDVSECIRLTKLQCHNNPGDKETSFPLKTWLPGEKPQKITIESNSWRWQEPFSSTQKTITITYQ